jgi:uncharacterized protein (DUF433 family)
MHGTPCFAGTRVPVRTLFDYLAAGHPLDDFFEDFPTVKPALVAAVMKLAGERLLAPEPAA